MSTGMSENVALTTSGPAADSAYDVLNEAMFTPPAWDSEIAGHGIYQLFGSWVKTLYDGEADSALNSTLLHDVLLMSNYIAMVMFIFLVMYVGWAAIMKTAADGEVLGKNWSPVWLPFRTGMAMALMFPMALSNPDGTESDVRVSMIQKFTIYLAFAGSELGDMAANVIYDNVGRKPITTPTTSHTQALSWFNDLYANYICHYIAEKYAPETKFRLKDVNVGLSRGQHKSFFNRDFDTVPDAIAVILAKQSELRAAGKIAPDMSIKFGGEKGFCGYVTIPGLPELYTGAGPDSETYVGDKMKAALKQYRTDLNVLAYSWTSTNIQVLSEMASTLAKAVVDLDVHEFESSEEKNSYSTAMVAQKDAFLDVIGSPGDTVSGASVHGTLNAFAQAMDTMSPSGLSDIMSLYKTQGWAGLGQLYFLTGLIGEIKPEIVKNYVSSTYTGTSVPEPRDFGIKDGGWWSSLFSSTDEKKAQMWDMEMNFKYSKYLQFVKSNSANLGSTPAGAVDCTDNNCQMNEQNMSDAFTATFSSAPLLELFVNGGDYDPTGDADTFPLARVQEAGTVLLATGFLIKTFHIVAESFFSGTETSIKESSMMPSLLKGAAIMALKIVFSLPLTLFFMASTVMMGAGSYLAYVLPMMPTLMWVMMVISYFIMVIEAFAASPLAVVQMATPEGEGISGTRMERAISILAALTLTPTLNVIGFIASITVMYIAFPLYNSMFFTAWSFIDGSEGAFVSFINAIPKLLILIVLYCSGLTMIIRQCYTIMPTIKQHILEWFSSGASRAFGENESSQRLDSMNEKLGSRASGMESAARQMKSQNDRSKAKDKEDEGGDTRGR